MIQFTTRYVRRARCFKSLDGEPATRHRWPANKGIFTPGALKLDLHVHTVFSHDGFVTLKEAVDKARRVGLDGIAFTDHDSIEACKRIPRFDDFVIVPGIEVSAKEGHVTGLNVSDPIPAGLSAAETIEKIHDLGGIAIAPHPNCLGKNSLSSRRIANLDIDGVETVNSSAFPFFAMTGINRRIASSLQLPVTGGSDSHFSSTIGFAYTDIDSSSIDIAEIVDAIRTKRSRAFGRPRRVSDRIRSYLVRAERLAMRSVTQMDLGRPKWRLSFPKVSRLREQP